MGVLPFADARRIEIQDIKENPLRQCYPANPPVPPSTRIPLEMIDKILTCDRSGLEKYLIFWRANQFGRGSDRSCVCLDLPTQSHTISCAYLAEIEKFDVNNMTTEQNWEELEVTMVGNMRRRKQTRMK